MKTCKHGINKLVRCGECIRGRWDAEQVKLKAERLEFLEQENAGLRKQIEQLHAEAGRSGQK